MAGIRKLPSGVYQASFIDWTGKRRWFTHNTVKSETLSEAEKLEDYHNLIRIGTLPAPKTSDAPRTFKEVAAEYLAWGAAQGGHGGRKWSPVHLKMRKRHLTKFWPKELNPVTVKDITLPRVEAALRTLATAKTGKTTQHHAESIKSLMLWSLQRGYIDADPLAGLAGFDVTPKERRAAFTVSQLTQLLEATPHERRLLYETAALSGYRKGELAALRVGDVDAKTNTLPLAAEFSKGRRDSRQPIPAALTEKLVSTTKGKLPTDPLFHVTWNLDRVFKTDLAAAKLPETVPGGKLVFHSLRHTFCTMLMDSGANLTEAQRLMRHQDPALTANTYSHARADRLQSVAEALGELVLTDEKSACGVHGVAAGAESTVVVDGCVESCKGSNPSLSATFVHLEHPQRLLKVDFGEELNLSKILPHLFSHWRDAWLLGPSLPRIL